MRIKDGKYKRWFTLAIIVLTIAVMTELPYMRWAMYEPLRLALGLTHTEFGASMSVFGTMAMLLYFPGGFLADRISHRKLFSFGAIGSGLIGYWFMTLPSYIEVLIIHGLWAITNIMMVWPTMIKAVSVLGDETEQGKLFGLFEGSRGIVLALVTTTMTTIISVLGSNEVGVTAVIGFVATASVGCGILAWFCMEDSAPEAQANASFKSVVDDMKAVISLPSSWICAGIMFSVYTAYTSSHYMNPYMQHVFGLSAVVTGYLTVFRKDVIRIFAAPFSGFLATKFGGQNAKVITWLAAVAIVILIMLIMTPPSRSPMVMGLIVVLTCVCAFCLYGMRGLYYAVIAEAKTPKHIYGAVAGFCSMFAFAPDAYNNLIIGFWLDNYDIAGYKYIFMYMIAALAGAIILCNLLIYVKKGKEAEALVAQEAK